MMRSSDGSTRRSTTVRRLGREKNPSVSSADFPSSISRVATPSQLTVNGSAASAGGTSNRLVNSDMNGRPSLRRMTSPYGVKGLSSTPSSTSRCRTAAAMRTAPGESPWTQIDSTVMGMTEPSSALTRPDLTIVATRSAI